jgi:hypothetical protein
VSKAAAMTTATTTTTTTNHNNYGISFIVAVVAIVLSGVLVSPCLWLSHDGHYSYSYSSSSSSSTTIGNNNDRNKDWEENILQNAKSYRNRVVEVASGGGDEMMKQHQEQIKAEPVPQHLPLQDVVILITGATSGIGQGLALWTYRHGATVIAMGRSTTKLSQLQQQLTKISSKEQRGEYANVDRRFFAVVADFSDLESLSTAVDTMKAKLNATASSANMATAASLFPNHIDLVVCNAGIHLGITTLWDPYQVTRQGYDLTFGGALVCLVIWIVLVYLVTYGNIFLNLLRSKIAMFLLCWVSELLVSLSLDGKVDKRNNLFGKFQVTTDCSCYINLSFCRRWK